MDTTNTTNTHTVSPPDEHSQVLRDRHSPCLTWYILLVSATAGGAVDGGLLPGRTE